MNPDPDGQLGHAHVEYCVDDVDARCGSEIESTLDRDELMEIGCEAIGDDGEVDGVEFRLDPNDMLVLLPSSVVFFVGVSMSSI